MFVDMHFHIDSRWHKTEFVDKTITDVEKNKMIVAAQACDFPGYFETVEIAKRSDFIFPAFGILPWYALDHIDRLDEIQAQFDNVGMLGEIGLDYLYSPPEATPEIQKKLLEPFLIEAEKNDKILNLHIRGASDDTLEILSSYNLGRVIFHAHSDSMESIQEGASRGYYFTINPNIVHNPNPDRLRVFHEVVKEVPTDLLLSEVDTVPETWVPPSSRLIETLEKIAELRGTTFDEIKSVVHRNSLRLMKGVPHLETVVGLME